MKDELIEKVARVILETSLWAVKWLSEQNDIESKLMALQILVRNIEAAQPTS
jgi:hypothetical protein